MFVLENYDFLEELVRPGFTPGSIFNKNGLCIADQEHNPNTVYVFRFEDNHIWADYAWTRSKNKAFLKFHRQVEKLMFDFGMPILRVGKNPDFKNHTVPVGKLGEDTVFQYIGGAHHG